jgi:hypothetical protein
VVRGGVMSNRYFDQLPAHVTFTETWGNKPGLGSWWKRALHKARRRYWREMIARGFWLDKVEPHPREPVRYESEVNWRCW